MDTQERKIIDDLFDKLSDAERQSSPPEPVAQAHILSRVERQPGAPYLMAQTIVAQEHALGAAQARIAALEEELTRRPTGGGGFLAGLFGGGDGQGEPRRVTQNASGTMQSPGQPAMGSSTQFGRGMPQAQPGRGSGFLAGAAQTAMGVAGGVLIGSMLGNAFGGGDKAQSTAGAEPEQVAANDIADAGDDLGGDFGGDEI
jgi:hypothetical protein